MDSTSIGSTSSELIPLAKPKPPPTVTLEVPAATAERIKARPESVRSEHGEGGRDPSSWNGSRPREIVQVLEVDGEGRPKRARVVDCTSGEAGYVDYADGYRQGPGGARVQPACGVEEGPMMLAEKLEVGSAEEAGRAIRELMRECVEGVSDREGEALFLALRGTWTKDGLSKASPERERKGSFLFRREHNSVSPWRSQPSLSEGSCHRRRELC